MLQASAYFSNQCSLYETGNAGLNQIDTVSAPRGGADYEYKYNITMTRNTRLRSTVEIHRRYEIKKRERGAGTEMIR